MTIDREHVTESVARYFHALSDMVAVQATLKRALESDASDTLRDMYVWQITETGLVVTYARPFVDRKVSGFPLKASRVVPSELRALHDELVQRRKDLYAHTDASAPTDRRRIVKSSPWEARGPVPMTEDQLRAFAELATAVRLRIETELGEEMSKPPHPDARLVPPSVPPLS